MEKEPKVQLITSSSTDCLEIGLLLVVWGCWGAWHTCHAAGAAQPRQPSARHPAQPAACPAALGSAAAAAPYASVSGRPSVKRSLPLANPAIFDGVMTLPCQQMKTARLCRGNERVPIIAVTYHLS